MILYLITNSHLGSDLGCILTTLAKYCPSFSNLRSQPPVTSAVYQGQPLQPGSHQLPYHTTQAAISYHTILPRAANSYHAEPHHSPVFSYQSFMTSHKHWDIHNILANPLYIFEHNSGSWIFPKYNIIEYKSGSWVSPKHYII